MHMSAHAVWLPRLSTFALAALAAGSAAYWGLQMSAPATGAALAPVNLQAPSLTDTAAVARALGAAGAATVTQTSGGSPALASSRFALAGVIAATSHSGSALIAVDGKAAKPYVVGARVGDEWQLRAVQPRRAVLARLDASGQPAEAGGPELVLELPVGAMLKGKNGP